MQEKQKNRKKIEKSTRDMRDGGLDYKTACVVSGLQSQHFIIINPGKSDRSVAVATAVVVWPAQRCY